MRERREKNRGTQPNKHATFGTRVPTSTKRCFARSCRSSGGGGSRGCQRSRSFVRRATLRLNLPTRPCVQDARRCARRAKANGRRSCRPATRRARARACTSAYPCSRTPVFLPCWPHPLPHVPVAPLLPPIALARARRTSYAEQSTQPSTQHTPTLSGPAHPSLARCLPRAVPRASCRSHRQSLAPPAMFSSSPSPRATRTNTRRARAR